MEIYQQQITKLNNRLNDLRNMLAVENNKFVELNIALRSTQLNIKNIKTTISQINSNIIKLRKESKKA